jgi:hypothetical protein
MRRVGTPEDIANVCALLCSEEAGFVTGQTISVDGGSSLMNLDFPHSPGFRGRRSASEGEGRSRLDFPLIHDVWSS